MAGFAQLSIGFGNGIGAPVSFLVAGLVLFLFAGGFIGMSRFIDNPGAFYKYIVVGVGRPPGLAGAFLATAAYVLLCIGSYPYMGLVAVESMNRMTGAPGLSWSAWAAVFLAIVTMTSLLRVDLSMQVLGKLVWLEIVLVAVWEAAVLIRGGPEGYALAAYTPAAFTHGSAGLGVLFAMVCMIGIEAAACYSAETKNPEVAVGQATYIAIVFMAVFYSLGAWLYIVTQGASHAVHNAVANPVGSFFTSVQTYLGGFFVKLVSLTLITSQMVAINSVQGAASRYIFALGRDRIFPSQFARVHPRLQSPYVAVVAVSIIGLLFLATIVLLRIDPVAAYAALTGTGIYFILPLLIATSCSVVAFYRKNPRIKAHYWARLVAPVLAALSLSVLFVLTTLNLKVFVGTAAMAVVSMVAVVVVPLAGWLPALRYRKTSPLKYQSIGNQ